MVSFLSLDKGRLFYPKLYLKDETREIFFTADWSINKACFEMQPSSEVFKNLQVHTCTFCTLTMVKKMTFLKGNLQMYIPVFVNIHLGPFIRF